MAAKYTVTSLTETAENPEKPGKRWELSESLGIESFNYNVAVLDAGERLSQNAYHSHENQAEFFHVIEGSVRVEVPGESFDLGEDECIRFAPGVPHLLHNVTGQPCRLVGIGDPPEGRYPVHQVQSHEALLAERYPDGNTDTPSDAV